MTTKKSQIFGFFWSPIFLPRVFFGFLAPSNLPPIDHRTDTIFLGYLPVYTSFMRCLLLRKKKTKKHQQGLQQQQRPELQRPIFRFKKF